MPTVPDASAGSGVYLDGLPNTAKWVARCLAREGTARGMAIPSDLKRTQAQLGAKAADETRNWFKRELAAKKGTD
jgi:hypothetical protein